MAKQTKVDNPAAREYIYQFAPKQLNTNPLFVKVFGKNFAEKMVRKNVIVVYTNEPTTIHSYAGYQTPKDKAITLCSSGENGQWLTPKEIAENEEIQETALHETVHAILTRTKKECKKYGIVGGTGLLERRKTGKEGIITELGRGLNEGYTEWTCEKAGLQSSAYTELTNLARLVEAAIGTKKMMELGKGDIIHRFPKILSMTPKEVNYLLAMSDNIYTINERLQTERELVRIIREHLNENESSFKSPEEYEENKGLIETYLKDPVFLNYVKTNQLEVSPESLQKYFKEVAIPELTKEKDTTIISVESFLLDRYFMRDMRNIFNSENISEEDFEKLSKIASFLNTKPVNVPENLKNMNPKMSSILVKEEFDKIAQNYIKQFAIREAEKYQKGELDLKTFIQKGKRICCTHFKLSQLLMDEFSKNVSQEFEENLKEVLVTLWNLSDCKNNREGIENGIIYRLVAENSEEEVKSSIIRNGDAFLDRFKNRDKILRTPEDEVKFNFTLDRKYKDEYEVVMKKFLELRDEIFARNPEAQIHIISREIIVQEGENLTFYKINNGNITKMKVKEQFTLNFQLEGEKAEDFPVVNLPVKVGFLSSFINRWKKSWHQITSKKKEETPNYHDELAGKIVFSKRENIEQYRIEDFEARIETPKQEKHMEKEENEIEEK